MPVPIGRHLGAPLASCLLAALSLTIGCTPEPTPGTGPDQHAIHPTTSPSPAATVMPSGAQATDVSFRTQIAPLLSDRCAYCHGSIGAGGVTLFDGSGDAVYSSIKARIASIIGEVSSGGMPRNGTRLSQSEVELLESWNDAGAPDN